MHKIKTTISELVNGKEEEIFRRVDYVHLRPETDAGIDVNVAVDAAERLRGILEKIVKEYNPDEVVFRPQWGGGFRFSMLIEDARRLLTGMKTPSPSDEQEHPS